MLTVAKCSATCARPSLYIPLAAPWPDVIMTAPKPVNCRYYYADFHRGRESEECRLIKRNRDSRPWHRSLCNSCPVPTILLNTNCQEIALEATVVKRFGLLERVTVYAICARHLIELDDPLACPRCAAEAEH
ncbi:MAG: hypothetical protein GXP37_10590 [Chloroflexi bacterium]|nr:hypothetical protein [Chloroflexota bacterium]